MSDIYNFANYHEFPDFTVEDYISSLKAQGFSDDAISNKIHSEEFYNWYLNTIQNLTDAKTEYYKTISSKIAHSEEQEINKFLEHNYSVWKNAFEHSLTMYSIAVNAAEQHSKYVDSLLPEFREKSKYTFLALQRIQGRTCQEFLEILCLLQNGFADGAFARWRSMYELCCIGHFIKQQGEQIAKQYIEQSHTVDQHYTWTSGAKNQNGKSIKITTFQALFNCCQIDKLWQQQYKLACLVNHASPQGTMRRLATGDQNDYISVGQSDYGLELAGEQSAVTLAWASQNFLHIFPCTDSLVAAKVLRNWTNIIFNSYETARKIGLSCVNLSKD